MARAISFFHPVKDLISKDEREFIKNAWYENDMHSFWNSENIENYLGTERFHSALNYSYGFHFKMHNHVMNDKFNSVYTKEFCDEIKNRYNGDYLNIIYAPDDTQPTVPHWDPKGEGMRQCCINLPIDPDYSIYRNTLFYEDEKAARENNPTYTVNYGALRSPVLLNNRKIHSTGNWHLPTSSLAVQICFYAPFAEVRNMLEEMKLLSTPV